jgi:hypothetical protein
MKRRKVLSIIALGALASRVDSLGAETRCAVDSNSAWVPAEYKLQFFTEAENQVLDQMMEMIIPADNHSAGASAAQTSLFADLMVATSDNPFKAQWRNGVRLMQQEAEKSSLAEALARAAAREEHPSTELEHFFVMLKKMTIDGYYTSEIGIHQDLEYEGNTYVAVFPGCPRLE